MKIRLALAGAKLPRNHPDTDARFWGSSQVPSRQTLSGSYTTSYLLWGTKTPETMSELLRAAQFTSSPLEPWWCCAKSSSKGFKGTGPPHKPKAERFIKWPWERTQKGHLETRDFWGTTLCKQWNICQSDPFERWIVQRSRNDLVDRKAKSRFRNILIQECCSFSDLSKLFGNEQHCGCEWRCRLRQPNLQSWPWVNA